MARAASMQPIRGITRSVFCGPPISVEQYDESVEGVNTMKAMRRILALAILVGAFTCPAIAQPVVTTVVNKTSYSAVLSPNSWVVIAGNNFATSSSSAPTGSSPTTLGGVSVTVAGLQAPLLSVSPHEI